MAEKSSRNEGIQARARKYILFNISAVEDPLALLPVTPISMAAPYRERKQRYEGMAIFASLPSAKVLGLYTD